ncbi:MAG: CDP-diacylglycerol--glycerol-3-phosphate 3-phosphatidyltransferase [Pseudomonadota bacterium]|nr:MAG: CDP-diacylglycerol--glycerol-3-phosphate 3-phosphatidyltransferase [Pseudomonadota bacterium]|tara:strand:+ start:7929 stop:8459 length:531 start_codon:yes stop_codon:yes gene_type:complete
MNLPNFLSISRLLLLIPIIFFFENGFYLLSAIIFIIASITDYLDGYIARKNNLSSEVGAILDLLSDKLFVSIILIWMTYYFESLFIFLSTILIVAREISISFLRLHLVLKSKDLSDVKADLFGKLKTVLQMFSLGIILISPYFDNLVFSFFEILLMMSAIFTWISLLKYLVSWNEK